MSRTLQRDKRVDEVESDGDGGYFIWLRRGLCALGDDGCHCFSEATVRDVLATLRWTRACRCEDCMAMEVQGDKEADVQQAG